MTSPLQGRKGGQAQWASPRWDHSDDLTVSPGVCEAKTWGSVPTWKSPKVRWQCLSEDGEEDLSWEDTGHPVWCWVLHEAQVWAMWGEGWLVTEGLNRPQGGATDGKGTAGDGERAQGAGKVSEESMKMPHKGISTEYPPQSREHQCLTSLLSFTAALEPVSGLGGRGEVDHACTPTAGFSAGRETL